MNSDLNTLLGIYLSTSAASIIMNIYIYNKNHHKIKKECLRNLKYRDGLSFKTKRHLRLIDVEHIYDIIDGIANSLLPIKNVFFTYENIQFSVEFDDLAKSVYDEIVDDANKIEDEYRKKNVDMLRSVKSDLLSIPNDIDLDNQNTRLNKKETKKILKLNHLNYDIEMLNFERENKE